MSQPKPPAPAKLVIGMFMKQRRLVAAAVEALHAEFGPSDMISPWLPFEQTDYYEPEMGAPLFRRLSSFKRLIDQIDLADIKLCTNRIEDRLRQDGRRQVNIDPGYLLAERFVLATGKNYSHRIFIGKGIYADLTLIFIKGSYRPLEWTYPDYREDRLRSYLNTTRRKYLDDLKRRPRI